MRELISAHTECHVLDLLPCGSCGAHKCSATLSMIVRKWKIYRERERNSWRQERENKMQNTTKQAGLQNNISSASAEIPWVDQPSSALVIIQLIKRMWIHNWRDCWSCAHGVFIDQAESVAGGLVLRLAARRESQALFCETNARTLLIRDLIYLIEHRETDGDLLQTVSFESGRMLQRNVRRTVLTVTHDAAARKNVQPVRLTTKEITHLCISFYVDWRAKIMDAFEKFSLWGTKLSAILFYLANFKIFLRKFK
jgi:hypothetical protein